MPTLYVTEPRAVVRRDGGSLVVTVDRPDDAGRECRRTLASVEPHRLEQLCLVGPVHVTHEAAMTCLDAGAGIAWLRTGGALRGRLVPPAARAADLRIRQYEAAGTPERRRDFGRRFVAAKLANGGEVLKGLLDNDPGNSGLLTARSRLRELVRRALGASSASALLGIEGTGSRIYWGALAGGFKAEISFDGRRRRPPPDPANALLSFGYVLLGNALGGMIEARGLDPALGFYHEVRPGRASLAQDLLEEFRHPVVDRFVLRTANLRIIRPLHFEEGDDGGVRMTREGLKRFFAEWEKFLLQGLRARDADGPRPARDWMARQVDRVAEALRGAGPYAPFRYVG